MMDLNVKADSGYFKWNGCKRYTRSGHDMSCPYRVYYRAMDEGFLQQPGFPQSLIPASGL